ncbi:MAG: efflux RND transporter permease subunit [Pseudomonadota bacterium]
MNVVDIFVRRKLLSWMIILASLIGGWLAYDNMPRYEDPEFLIRTAQVVVEYPGAAPEDVAEEVVDAIETSIQSLQEVSEIRSTAYFGFAIIEVDIKHTFSKTPSDLQLIWTRLRSRVADAESDLPPGAGTPIVNDDFGDVFGLYYLVTGSGFTIQELDDYAQDLRADLLGVDGVAKVVTQGEQQEAIYIELARDRAAALGVSLSTVFEALNNQNAIVSAGSFKMGAQRIVIQPTGTIDSVEAIKAVRVKIAGESDLVPLGSIASIQRGLLEPTQLISRFNGQPAIALGISIESGGNVSRIAADVRTVLAKTIAERPNGVYVDEFYHQGDAVDAAVSDFTMNVIMALLIVLVTLFLFMGWRSALVIGAILTITIAATLTVMVLTGIPIHRISLGALIIALGMLVDNAIVITEGILIGTQAGRSVLASARDVVGKTKWALLGGTIVGIIAFAPVGFAPGDTAEYTNHLFWVICISLSFSWIFAITLVPMLSDLVFQTRETASETPVRGGRGMRAYKAFLRVVLKGRWVVIGAAAAVFCVSIMAAGQIKEGFFPTATTPQIAIDYWLPEGTDIQATAIDVEAIEEQLSAYDGINAIYTNIGGSPMRYMLIFNPEIPNGAFAQLVLNIDDPEQIDSLISKIQTDLDERYPQAQARVWRFRLGPSQGSRIEAVFSGPDPAELRALAAQAEAIMIRDPDTVGIKIDWRQQTPVYEPEYDPVRGARLGVSRQTFSEALNATFSGQAVGVYREDNDLIPILTRAPASERKGIDDLSTIQVISATTGQAVPISEVMRDADFHWRDGQLRRQDREWTIQVQADPVPTRLTTEVFQKLKPQIEAIPRAPGYTLVWDGEFGASNKANAELATTVPPGLIAMVLVVVLLFNALRQPIIIWLTVPLAMVGVVIGLITTGTALEFMAILGVLSLSGLLIKNAIVLIDQMDLEIREGKPRFDAVVDSAASRVRPVLMGSLTTILGVFPLMSDIFFASMAVVIVFGLAFATLLTLIVIPALYAAMFRVRPSETKTQEA